MARTVVPVRDIARRLPNAGRIRIGVKSGKAMHAIDTFRFTSQDRTALDQVAAIYGGEVQPWNEPKAAKGQFEVITQASEIRIALPPDPLGSTPIYEMWSGGGCARRCDGETCEMLVSGQDGLDMTQVECICFAKGALECRLITRLSVLLPEIRFVGVWRIDTKSDNAAKELPGMVDLIQQLQGQGIQRGILSIADRMSVTAGETHRFKVPVLGIDESVEALASGAARLGALGATSEAIAALGAGQFEEGADPPLQGDAQQDPGTPGDIDGGRSPHAVGTEAPSSTSDDDIVDAELVDDDSVAVLVRAADTGPKKSKALRAARLWAEHKGMVLPGSFDEITDPVLAGKAIDALVDA